jgi:Domain of unknown function (DUF4383)
MWRQSLEDKGTFLKRGVLVFALFQIGVSIYGLIYNPDFTTGEPVAKQMFGLIDINGWHALVAILLYLPAFFVLRSTAWTQWYTVVAIAGTLLPSVWILFQKNPLGLIALPNPVPDSIYHIVSAAVLGAILAIHVWQANRKVTEAQGPERAAASRRGAA